MKANRLWLFLMMLALAWVLGIGLPSHGDHKPAAPAYAQDGGSTDTNAACDGLVQAALEVISDNCTGLGRNEICYGNDFISATLVEDSPYFFDRPGDIIPVTEVLSLNTSSINPDTDDWGIALMDLQADLPDSEDSVRVVLFGGAQIEPTSTESESLETCRFSNTASTNIDLYARPTSDSRVVDVLGFGEDLAVYGQSSDGQWLRSARGWVAASNGELSCEKEAPRTMDTNAEGFVAPMQSFSLQVDEQANCQAAPSGMLIQTPRGQTANLMVNGVELRVGSTAQVNIDENGCQDVFNHDGNVNVQVGGTEEDLPVGSQVTISVLNRECGRPLNNISPIPEEERTRTTELTTQLRDSQAIYYETQGEAYTPAPPSLDVSSDVESVIYGECAALTWASVNADTVRINGQNVALSNTREFCPEEPSTYAFIATPIDENFDPVEVSLEIDVIYPPAEAALSSDVEALTVGGCLELSYVVEYLESFEISGTDVVGDLESLDGSTEICFEEAGENEIVLSGVGLDGEAYEFSILIAVYAIPEFSFTSENGTPNANGEIILLAGQNLNYAWEVDDNASEVLLDGEPVDFSGSVNRPAPTPGTYTYTLTIIDYSENEYEAALTFVVRPDSDSDGVPDTQDACPDQPNDAFGDPCNPDDDGDGVPDTEDACPLIPNDAIGDPCNPDQDGDSLLDGLDNCPFVSNVNQNDNDGDGIGDVCDEDTDGDGVTDGMDNCINTPNADQGDVDRDGVGDVCDSNADGDAFDNVDDECPLQPGTATILQGCPDADADGFDDSTDNCPNDPNPAQTDSDGDGPGDACDPIRADLSADITVTDPAPDYGDPVSFDITITNNGPNIATNAVYDLNGLLTECDGSTTLPISNINISIGDLSPGEDYTITITPDTFTYCEAAYTIDVDNDTVDPTIANNSDSDSYLIPQVDLAVTITGGPVTGYRTGTYTYNWEIRNLGGSTAYNVQYEELFSGTFCDGSPAASSPVINLVGDIPPGAVVTDFFIVDSELICDQSTTLNIVTYTGASESNLANNSDSVSYTVSPDVALYWVLSPSLGTNPDFGSGDNFLTIEMTNTGPATAFGVDWEITGTVTDCATGLTSPYGGTFDVNVNIPSGGITELAVQAFNTDIYCDIDLTFSITNIGDSNQTNLGETSQSILITTTPPDIQAGASVSNATPDYNSGIVTITGSMFNSGLGAARFDVRETFTEYYCDGDLVADNTYSFDYNNEYPDAGVTSDYPTSFDTAITCRVDYTIELLNMDLPYADRVVGNNSATTSFEVRAPNLGLNVVYERPSPFDYGVTNSLGYEVYVTNTGGGSASGVVIDVDENVVGCGGGAVNIPYSTAPLDIPADGTVLAFSGNIDVSAFCSGTVFAASNGPTRPYASGPFFLPTAFQVNQPELTADVQIVRISPTQVEISFIIINSGSMAASSVDWTFSFSPISGCVTGGSNPAGNTLVPIGTSTVGGVTINDPAGNNCQASIDFSVISNGEPEQNTIDNNISFVYVTP